MRNAVLILLVACGSTTAPPDGGGGAEAGTDVAQATCGGTARVVAPVDVWDLAQDAANLYAIVTGATGATVVRIAKGSGAMTTIASGFPSDQQAQRLAVDANGVYVAFAGTAPNVMGSVMSFPLVGGPGATIAPNRPFNFYGNIVVAEGTLFWTEGDPQVGTGSVAAMATSGGTIRSIQNGPTDRTPMQVAYGGGYVWWTTVGDNDNSSSLGKQLMRATPQGVPELVSPQAGLPDQVATNAAAVVYNTGPALGALPFAASVATPLDQAVVNASDLDVDEANAYVIVGISALRRAPLDGGSATELDTAQGMLGPVVVDGACVYWWKSGVGVLTLSK